MTSRLRTLGGRRTLDVLLVALLTSVLVLPWHATNRKLPHFDAADFAITALRIEHHMRDGVVPGVVAMYHERDWRPILFPSLAAPFFFATGGNLRAGIAATQFALLLCTGLYGLALARRFLPRGSALLAALCIVSLPWIVGFGTIFYAELAWLTFTIGWLYHTVASNDFRVRRHAVLSGVLLALMACVRPVETTITALPALGCFAVLAWRRGTLRWTGLLTTSLVGAMLAVLWWAPFADALYTWAYAASFGSLALTTDQRYRGIGIWTVVREGVIAYAPYTLATLAGVATIAMTGGARQEQRKADASSTATRPVEILLVALVMFASVVAVLMLTGTSSYRRFVPAFLAGYVALTILALEPRARLWRLRATAIASLTAFQIFLIVANGLGARPAALAGAYDAWLDNVARPDPSPDVSDSMLTALVSTMTLTLTLDTTGPAFVATHGLCYFDDLAGCSSNHIPWFEPAAMNAVALARRSTLTFSSSNDLDPTRPDRFAQHLRDSGFEYLLLDLLDREGLRDSPIPYVMATSGMIRAATRDGRIPGLVPVRRWALGPREIVLFKVAPETVDAPTIASAPVGVMDIR